jgi:ABC-type transport system involved in multi-copper enzyme maturation permease subunit
MIPTDSPRVLGAEITRWSRDRGILILVGVLLLLLGALTYLAVLVAAGPPSTSTGSVQIQTDLTLTTTSTNDDLASMARSSIVMLVPLAAVVLGAHVAGNEMSSGALLHIATATRRLRHLFAVRAGVLAVLLTVVAALAALVTMAAAAAAVAGTPDLSRLSAASAAGQLIAGSVAQALLVGLIAFALAVLTRHPVAIVIAMLVYLVALEPIVQGLVGDGGAWLPRAASAQVLQADALWYHLLPTVVVAVALLVVAVASARRDRAFR